MDPSPWAQKRKLIYTSVVVGALVVIGSVQAFRIFYEAPTCFDGRQNGQETGVDCGGECRRVCEFEAESLTVKWSKYFEIFDGVYTAVAYVENPNRAVGAESLPYSFEFFDSSGEKIEEIVGKTHALPNSNIPIFVGPIEMSEEPDNMEFSFGEELYLVHSDADEVPIEVENTTLISSETNPKLRALLFNTSVAPLEDVSAVALVYDSNEKAIAASRTIVPYLPSDERERITFTWPEAFKVEPSVCSQPVSAMLSIDRSGSMNDDGGNPEQPITDALNAASTFVDNLSENDKSGVVSYATESSVDVGLTSNREQVSEGVRDISILPKDETGYTNIGAGISDARSEIVNDPDFKVGERNSVIVVLTDGIANWPQDPGGEEYARNQSQIAKEEGIEIYTIGLGNDVNREFLSSIATAPNYYFEAVSVEDLEGIYEEIGTAVCTLGPSTIEVVPRYNNVSQDS
ncbi:MAG: vWA domain-containing protein [Candidatus Campbellbacteria bacterium]|nr:vWA domain-containing protein [Candidatus Campbellbacteria bacterium]